MNNIYGKTSRYTYNAAGERVMKSYGTMEGVYINGAPQGITFHETDNFTLYPASILSVNKNRFTKHYFLGDKRVASRIGTGLFNNVYGRNGSYVTAGQQDYAERMNQIQTQKEAYYKKVGVAPGVPTEKGAYGDPENTGVGYNAVLTELGNHDVPQGWIQTPHPNTTPGTNPGPPVSWNDPTNPDDPQAGYGYIPNDTTKEETFFYHSDHLGSTSYITDDHTNITQYDAYLPYGELLVDEHSSSEDLPYKFNGKQFDEETGLYYYGARYMNPVASLWYGVDPQIEKMPKDGSYSYCFGNPIKLIDPNGERPTEEEAARISAHVYGTEKVTLTGGWHLSKLNKTLSDIITLKDKKSGFKSAIYERTYKGKTEYVYATAGTDFTEMNDWKNNIKQIIGKSEQYDISMSNAEKISQVIGNSELTFTGHSLGGGLAAANAYKTGRSAMTFNAAWVSPFTIFNRKFPRIDAYINVQDELDKVQRTFGLRADGFPHYRFNRRALLGHSIQNFYRTDIELMKDEIKAKNELYQRMYIDSFHGFPQ